MKPTDVVLETIPKGMRPDMAKPAFRRACVVPFSGRHHAARMVRVDGECGMAACMH
jgi:hypothetical protein